MQTLINIVIITTLIFLLTVITKNIKKRKISKLNLLEQQRLNEIAIEDSTKKVLELYKYIDLIQVELSRYLERNQYFDGQEAALFQCKWNQYIAEIDRVNFDSKFNCEQSIIEQLKSIKTQFHSLEQIRNEHNTKFVNHEIKVYSDMFGNIENKAMDHQQQISAVTDERSTLVIAGAGSGKTLTLLGKIKYLIAKYNLDPSEIVVLVFNKKNAEEFAERAEVEFGMVLEVKTFHSLGNSIISEGTKDKYKLDSKLLADFVDLHFDNLIADPVRLKKYVMFMSFYFSGYVDPHDGKYTTNKALYDTDVECNKRVTLKGDRADSIEERVVADYLTMNGIKYSQGKPYPHEVESEGYGTYKPDFQFSEYHNIYLEHFGIDRDKNVPYFFTSKSDKSAKTEYNDKIDWKYKVHAENNTILLATYSYQFTEGIIFEELDKLLDQYGIRRNPISDKELLKFIDNNQSAEVSAFKKVLITAIGHIKGNQLSISNIRNLNNKIDQDFMRKRNELMIDLIEDVHNAYQKRLEHVGRIDFNDMITKGSELIEDGTVKKNYKYIIVDEYQDISRGRFKLIDALRDACNAKLFCVGDDWQSIYRFTGSQVGLFTKFSDIIEYSQVTYIEQTFRYSQDIANIAKRFVEKNPNQVKKAVISTKVLEDSNVYPIYGRGEISLFNELQDHLAKIPDNNSTDKPLTVMLLGRYKSDFNKLVEKGLLDYKKIEKEDTYSLPNRPDLLIDCRTIHRSKGLEADYIYILNNKGGRFGFPSRIENDPIINLLLDQSESHPFAEERRLMYVAITRAKEKCFVLVDSTNKSVFVEEFENELAWVNNESDDYPKCRTCGSGMVTRTGRFGDFWACLAFPKCNTTVSIKKKFN